MNKIEEIQNEPPQLQKLAAQRELYSAAKRRFGLQFLGSIAIPTVLTLASLFIHPSISVFSALYAICFFVVDVVLLEPKIKVLKARAAKIQELFDTVVLDLPTSPFKTATDITVEEVLTHYDAHAKIDTNVEKLRNWYNVGVGRADISVARLICQRASFAWACGLHTSYSNFLKWILVILILVVLVTVAILRLPLLEVTLILSGVIPIFRFLIKQYQENAESKTKLSRINDFFNGLWTRIIANDIETKELDDSARRIQDELFENRVSGPLIPDRFYKSYRPKNESLMLRTGESLVEELINTNNHLSRAD